MLRTLLSYGLMALAASGCATLSQGPPQTEDEVIRRRMSVKPSRAIQAELEQTGTILQVTAQQMCDLVEVRDIHRTTRYELENEALVPELVLLGVGTVPAGLGAGLLIDAGSVYPSDRHARLYNTSGPDGARAAGIVLLLWGGAMMAVPLIDFARSVGSKEEESTLTEEGSIIRPGVPCEGGMKAAAYKTVTGRTPAATFSIGGTDAEGAYKADLVKVVPHRIFTTTASPPTSMEVWIDDTRVGVASLEGVERIQAEDLAKRDEEAWRAIDVVACKYAKDERLCDPVRAYTQQFPGGAHIEEARRLLDPSARQTQVQVAASPEDLAKAEAAQKALEQATEAAKKAAGEACRKKCEAACKKDAGCTKACAEEACQ